MPSQRRLAAIMFTDIVGYTALMGRDEELAFKILDQNRRIQRPLIEKFDGEWLKEMGDGVLAAFPSTTNALKCAEEIIVAAKAKDIGLRIGIHLGEVVFQNGDVFGDGVNVAARVEAIGVPGSVLLTEKVYDDIRNKPDFKATSLGEFSLKNVTKPIEIYALDADGLVVPDRAAMKASTSPQKGNPVENKWHKQLILGAMLLLVLGYIGKEFLYDDVAEPQSREIANKMSPEIVSLACLPFSNVSQDAEIDFLGFALVDQVISSLSYLKNVAIRPSSSIRQYSDAAVLPEQVGEALDVRYVLTGNYMKNGDTVRLNIQLIDIEDNQVMWTGKVHEPIADVFKLQDIVAQRVIEGLEIQFSQDERTRMVKDIPDDPLAYEYYLKSLNYPQSVEGNQLALDMLKKSIELDSGFAPFFIEIGNRTQQMARYMVIENRSKYIDEAVGALEYALELNDVNLKALGILTLVKNELNQKDQAIQFARRIVSLNPNNAYGHFALGYIYRYTGLVEEAVNEMEIAVKIDPKNRQFRSIGVTYNMAGRYDDAIISLKNYADGSGFSEAWLGLTYMRMGDYKNARTWLSKCWQIDSVSTIGMWAGAKLAYLDGRQEGWLDRIIRIEKVAEDPESMYSWLVVNIMYGDFESALQLLEKAVDLGYYPYPGFLTDPLLDPVRDDPDFKRILERAKSKHEAFKAKHID